MINKEIESPVLNGVLLGSRRHLGLKSKTNKNRFKPLPLFDCSSQPNRRIMVALEDYPASLLMMRLPVPAKLGGEANPEEMGLWYHNFTLRLDILAAKYGLTDFAPPSLDSHAFCRFLAKIAHAYAAGELGLDRFEPLLPAYILAGSEIDHELIGGGPPLEPNGAMHRLKLRAESVDGRVLVVATISLFTPFNPPTYDVVVGYLRPVVDKDDAAPVPDA